MQRLLSHYDFVLCIDADAIIIDGSTDIETIVPPDAYQSFAVIQCSEGRGTQPAVGVWALRAGQRAQDFLAEVWRHEEFRTHHLQETAAVMRLLGWTTEPPFRQVGPSPWWDGCHVLDEQWDVVPQLPIGYASGMIRHYAGWPNHRSRAFDMRTDLAKMEGQRGPAIPSVHWSGGTGRGTGR